MKSQLLLFPSVLITSCPVHVFLNMQVIQKEWYGLFMLYIRGKSLSPLTVLSKDSNDLLNSCGRS